MQANENGHGIFGRAGYMLQRNPTISCMWIDGYWRGYCARSSASARAMPAITDKDNKQVICDDFGAMESKQFSAVA